MGVQASFPSSVNPVLANGFDPALSEEDAYDLLWRKHKIPFSRISKKKGDCKAIIFFDNFKDLNDGINRLEVMKVNNHCLTVLPMSLTSDLLSVFEGSKKVKIPTRSTYDVDVAMPFRDMKIKEIINKKKMEIEKSVSLFHSGFSIKKEDIEIVGSYSTSEYLNCAKFEVGMTAEGVRNIGFVSGGKTNNYIIPLQNSSCYNQKIVETAKTFAQFMEETKEEEQAEKSENNQWKSVFVYIGKTESFLVIEVENEIDERTGVKLMVLFGSFNTIVVTNTKGMITKLTKKNHIYDNIYGLAFPIYASVPTIPNTMTFEHLISTLCESELFQTKRTIYDVFSSNGILSMCLSKQADKVRLVCSNDKPYIYQKIIKKNNLENVSFFVGDETAVLTSMLPLPSQEKLVLIIEPQQDTQLATIDAVSKIAIKTNVKNILLFCESQPVLMQSLPYFSSKYIIKKFYIVDYYQHSPKMASLVHLSRA